MNTQTQTSYFVSAFLSFLFITWIFFRFKPDIKESITSADSTVYTNQNYQVTGLYYFILLISQICVGFSVVTANGCDITQNNVIMTIAMYTLIPWVLIYGVLILIILINSNYKSAFSNVFGYMWVSASATEVLTKLFIPKVVTSQTGVNNTANIQNTADAIFKICGNPFVLINEITPDNFIDYMDKLQPLFKTGNVFDKNDFKNYKSGNVFYDLFEVVSTRDSIGLFAWYIYTAILVISIANYNIASIPCE